jgi:hypothetical protein
MTQTACPTKTSLAETRCHAEAPILGVEVDSEIRRQRSFDNRALAAIRVPLAEAVAPTP